MSCGGAKLELFKWFTVSTLGKTYCATDFSLANFILTLKITTASALQHFEAFSHNNYCCQKYNLPQFCRKTKQNLYFYNVNTDSYKGYVIMLILW